MPAMSSYPVVSSRSDSAFGNGPAAPPSQLVLGVLISTVVFLVAVGILMTWLLCFYRERHEICWLPKLCCGRKQKPKPQSRSFRWSVSNLDYALSAEARRSRTNAAIGLGREMDDLGAYFRNPRSRNSELKKDQDDGSKFVVGDEEEGIGLHPIDPPKPPPSSLRPFPNNEAQADAPMPAPATIEWPELPPRPAASKLKKNRATVSALMFGRGGKETLRRDSV
ncbi:uncharacterized protein BDZ99DRAFT_17241 [Mytilinidion resinicola]|uniref:Uncharacterized protein n=1 Tax=Mytilinidion resinicola TaxID=574789 RepID=A0A6A6Z8P7_9PEZI|nr:uncharacterized protein BDZ99DRAFT_17241 [Mytilinidion resinicola]KAF2817502.1 hypothetical protein BDZ99DRAFT_17241 [Mytilinidion resinicola]